MSNPNDGNDESGDEPRVVDGSFFDYYRDYLSESAIVDLGVPREVLVSEVGPPDLRHTSGTNLYDPERLADLDRDVDARLALAPFFGDFRRFQGRVGGFDSYFDDDGEEQKTLVLLDVLELETEKTVADHMWFDYGDALHRIQPESGDTLEFDSRVELYEKGYRGRDPDMRRENPMRVDFQLVDLRNVERLEP